MLHDQKHVAAAAPPPKKQSGHELLELKGCSVLNAGQPAALDAVLTAAGGELCSDCDEQLLISVSFAQPVKLHSVLVGGPIGTAPAELQLFTNRTAMAFDDCEAEAPTQILALASMDVADGGKVVPLQYVKFQNVSSLTLFIPANQGGGDVTTLQKLQVRQASRHGAGASQHRHSPAPRPLTPPAPCCTQFFGTPIATTNMSDLKSVG